MKGSNTPPKTFAVKSQHDIDNKSQNMSMDELPPKRGIRKGEKEKSFENKIKMFMERSEVDRDLEEKVKRRLIEISTRCDRQSRRSLWAAESGWKIRKRVYGSSDEATLQSL